MKPMIESDLAVLAILLALLGVCALVAWFVERRAWYRGVQMHVERGPDPAAQRDFDSIALHRRHLDTRDAQ